MIKAQLILEYLKVLLSAQMVVGVVVVVFIALFKVDIRTLIARIAKIRLPGGSELLTTQLEKSAEMPEASQSNKPKPSPESVDLPENLSLTPEQVDIIRKYLQAEKANAALWEYRYLNYFLAAGTQVVLDWLNILKEGTSLSLFNNSWHPLIPNANERSAILNALQAHFLIQLTGEFLEITPKGREYVQWRGPLPNPKT